MFISRKKLNRIIEEERYKERERINQDYYRQEEREKIDRRFGELEREVWKLREEIEQMKRKKTKR